MYFKTWILGGLLMAMQIGASSQTRKAAVQVFNAGYNGNNTADLLARLDKDVSSHAPDLVVMMIGTNDMLNERNILSVDSFTHNYETLIKTIKPASTLVLMTIPPVNSSYIRARKPEMKFAPDGPQRRVDSANAVIKRLANQYRCSLIDLHAILMSCGGSNTTPESLFQNEANSNIDDGVHPTYSGYRVIATAVFQTIRLKWPKAKKIVCFGDSITFGYRMKGAGTAKVDGQCYPAILQAMFNN